jgi:hypothetical protein
VCGVRGVAAAGILAAVLNFDICVTSVRASEAGREDPRFLFFSSGDAWRHGGFVHGGMLWSPYGLDHAGPALKAMLGGGTYGYISGALANKAVTGHQTSGAFLPGWRFIHGRLFATVFAGLDIQTHRLFPDDPSAGLRGRYIGFRTSVELWYEPTTVTMATADGSFSSIGPSYSGRAAFGWRAFDRYYVGPEVAGFTSGENYRQFRAGVHLTGLRTNLVEWSGGVGWSGDSDKRSSLYGRVGILLRR